MPLRFHAAPPDGEWINDPNALFKLAGGFRLLVQHRADAPDFRASGWGAFESRDLLDWRWAGQALPADPDGWAYSGSAVRADGAVELFHSVHDSGSGLQHQRRLRQDENGDWRACADDAALATPRANRRDPFVFAWGGEWRMLLTQSCDWHCWRGEPPSQLVVLASADRATWREVGRIGPSMPAGVMWEVPVLVRIGDVDVLFVSLVDRRAGTARCSVRGWVGRFDGTAFVPDPAFPVDGQRIDLGPDFYALMPGVDGDWPDERPFVAWAASWETARAPIWPEFGGGPISLPRRIAVASDERGLRLAITPLPGLAAHFRSTGERPAAGRGVAEIDGAFPFALVVTGDAAALRIEGDPDSGRLVAKREAAGAFGWSTEHGDVVCACSRRRLVLFIDGPLVEWFDEASGLSLTAALPGGVCDVSLTVDGRNAAFGWSSYTG